MIQSSFPGSPAGIHAAIIMDGNGRWARARGRPRATGHRVGAKVAKRIVEAAPDLGIGTLTLYAFSSDNWGRPAWEVRSLMRLFRAYLRSETTTCVRQGVRLSVVGRRDRFDDLLLHAIDDAERETREGRRLHLRIALDYSSRDAIMAAALRWSLEGGQPMPPAEPLTRESFAAVLGQAMHMGEPSADVDLLIRTGGEHRLSDFLLWESAYAELVFSERMWPDFTGTDLAVAIADYHSRDRRFGRVLEVTA